MFPNPQSALRILALAGLTLALAASLPAAPRIRLPVKTTPGAPPSAERLDLNHVSREQLLKLPGITPIWADRILRFRPYRTRLDLVDSGVLSEPLYDRIKDYVVVHKDKP